MDKTSRREFATFVVGAALLAFAGIVAGIFYLLLPAKHSDVRPENVNQNQHTSVNVNVKCDGGIPTVWGNG
jgi:hypothetical protein